MVFHPALLIHRQGGVGKKQVQKTGFSLSGKGLRVRKVGEGKGKAIHVEMFGLLSDRFVGLLHGFKNE